jgi:hypothetical protein
MFVFEHKMLIFLWGWVFLSLLPTYIGVIFASVLLLLCRWLCLVLQSIKGGVAFPDFSVQQSTSPKSAQKVSRKQHST